MSIKDTEKKIDKCGESFKKWVTFTGTTGTHDNALFFGRAISQ